MSYSLHGWTQPIQTFLKNTVYTLLIAVLALSSTLAVTLPAMAAEVPDDDISLSTLPEPTLTAENFNTHQGADYTGVNVGFNVENYEYFEYVSVELFDEDGNSIVKNVGNTTLLYEIVIDGSGQFSTPFILEDLSYDKDSDDYWTFGEWQSYNTPAEAVVTVNNETVKITNLSEPNGWLFSTLVEELIEQDNTQPTHTIDSHSNGDFVGGAFTLSGTATDDLSGIKEVSVQVNRIEGGQSPSVEIGRTNANFNEHTGEWSFYADTSDFEDGLHRFNVNSVDNAGNTRRAPNVDLVVDNTQPTHTIDSHSNGDSVGGTIDLKGTADDSLSGVKAVTVQVNRVTGVGGSFDGNQQGRQVAEYNEYTGEWSFTVDTSNFADGAYRFAVNTVDNSGNKRFSPWVDLIVDNTKPTHTITSHSSSDAVSGVFKLEGTATDNLSGVDKVTVQINKITKVGGTFISVAQSRQNAVYENGEWHLATDTTQFSDGVYRFHVNSVDNAGNVRYAPNVDLVVDNTKPVHTIDSHSNGNLVNGTITLEGAATDNLSGINKVSVQINEITQVNGSFVAVAQSRQNATFDYKTKTWSFEVDTTSLNNGTYRFHVNSVDNAGNVRYAPNVDLVVDNSTPELPDLTDDDAGDDSVVESGNQQQGSDSEQPAVGGGQVALATAGEPAPASGGGDDFVVQTEEATDEDEDATEGETLGGATDEDEESDVAAAVDEGNNEAGNAWMLWVLLAAGIAALLYFFAKRRAEQE